MLKNVACILLFLPTLLLAGWGSFETSEYRILAQNRLTITNPLLNLPIVPDVKPGTIVFVNPKDGVVVGKQYEITLRFVGKDGKTYRQTLAADTFWHNGFSVVFEVDATNVLGVSVERKTPPVIEEAQ